MAVPQMRVALTEQRAVLRDSVERQVRQRVHLIDALSGHYSFRDDLIPLGQIVPALLTRTQPLPCDHSDEDEM